MKQNSFDNINHNPHASKHMGKFVNRLKKLQYFKMQDFKQ